MTCRQAFDIDLSAFLAEPRAAAFERFRAHYPACPACTAEVRAWTDVHVALSGGRGSRHPEPAALLAFDSGRPALPEAERRAVEAHLTACTSCRDELAALHAADRAGLTVRAAERRPGLLDRLRTLVLHPAFAYALVLVLVYPALRGVRETEERRPAVAPAAPAPAPPAPQAPAPRVPSAAEPAPGARGAPAPKPAPRREAAREAPPPAPAGGPAGYGPTADALSSELRTQAAAPAAVPAAPGAVSLAPGAAAHIDRASAGERVTLRVPMPAGAGGTLEARIVASDGRREIRERIGRPAGGEPVVLDVPAAWLEPGSYAVEVRDPASGDLPIATYGLTVR